MKFEGIDDDEIVISGIGCKFPDADNLPELTEKLFSGVNLVTKDDRKVTQGEIFFINKKNSAKCFSLSRQISKSWQKLKNCGIIFFYYGFWANFARLGRAYNFCSNVRTNSCPWLQFTLFSNLVKHFSAYFFSIAESS